MIGSALARRKSVAAVRKAAHRVLVSARRHRVRACLITVAPAVGAPVAVLLSLPHEWRYVAPCVAIWAAATFVLCLIFGFGRVLTIVATGLGAGAALGIPWAWIVHDYPQISGVATCSSGAAVEGVYVRAEDGEEGFAGWSPRGRENVAYFRFPLHSSVPYRLGVGCGGSPQEWKGGFVTQETRDYHVSVTCRDDGMRGKRIFGRCTISPE